MPLAEVVHGRGGELGVVRGGQRADVARRAGQVLAQFGAGAAVVHELADRVELAAVPVRAVQRGDRPGVVEEGVRVPQPAGEGEPVGDVGYAVTVVVDVDLVADVVAELVEVRAAGRCLERDVVGDQRDGVGPVGAHERIEVGAVGDRVHGNFGSLAMGRHQLPHKLVLGQAPGLVRRSARQCGLGGQRTCRIAGPIGRPYPGSTGQGVRQEAAGGLFLGAQGWGESQVGGAAGPRSADAACGGQRMACASLAARSGSRSWVLDSPANTSISPDRRSRTCTMTGSAGLAAPAAWPVCARGAAAADAAAAGGESADRGGGQARPGEARRTVKDGSPGWPRVIGAFCRAVSGLIRVDL